MFDIPGLRIPQGQQDQGGRVPAQKDKGVVRREHQAPNAREPGSMRAYVYPLDKLRCGQARVKLKTTKKNYMRLILGLIN